MFGAKHIIRVPALMSSKSDEGRLEEQGKKV
jgi:hypothetical protein